MKKAERERRYAPNREQQWLEVVEKDRALRDELVALKADNAALNATLDDMQTRAVNLCADNAALRQDALRYRWLRRHNPQWVGFAMHESTFSRVDADVDAAMREGKEK